MITADFTGNLGNHMWQYVICRTVAQKNGFQWGFNRTPSHDYFHGLEQMDFMDIEYGQEHSSSFGESPEGIDKVWKEKKVFHEHAGGYNFHPYQPDIFEINDNTKLIIECCQDERYIKDRKGDIRNWFKIKPEKIDEYEKRLKGEKISLDDDLCVINIRGGSEYRALKNVLLPVTYWENAIAYMKKQNPNMRFIVISDDVKYASELLPFKAYHFSIGMDYYCINQARNLILSNSSFALLPAWLNEKCKMIIAPKYWARHNISFGYWASSAVYMEGWNYLDRDGNLFSYEEIIKEESEKMKKDRKVYDAILFFNELDILEIRLNTLDPVVDYFIISESTKTHSGLPKPLYFQENRDRFKKFEHKIIHQVLEDTPDDYLNLSEDSAKNELQRLVFEKVNRGDWWPHDVPSYGRDTYEKEAVLCAMGNCKPDDLILFSDADEIPNPETLKLVLENFNSKNIYNFKQRMFFYYFNCEKEDNWVGNTLLTFEKFKELSACELRVRRRGIFVEDGGWHFSFMGGAERIKQKIESYGEQSLNTPEIKENIQSNIDHCITTGRDLFNRPCHFWFVPIDDTYPKFIKENVESFSGYIKTISQSDIQKPSKFKSGSIYNFLRRVKHKMKRVLTNIRKHL